MKNNMFNYKKALGPVVAISLLMVVTVIGVMSFNTFFTSYSSDLYLKSEGKGGTDLTITSFLENSGGLYLYAKTKSGYVVIDNVKINDVSCSLTGSNVIDNTNTEISLGCTPTTGNNRVVVYTDSGIFTKEFFI